MTGPHPIAIGKPAEFGQELLRRRDRLVRRHTTLTGKKVLDFGCGNGAQSMTIARDAAFVVGMDVSMNHLSAMQHNLDVTAAESLFGVCIDGTAIPSRDATYDLVVSFEVLEHVQDERRTLQEIFRVLKPAGECILTVPNKWWIFETHGARLPWLKWNRVPLFSWLPTRLHRRWAMARIYRRGEILSLLASTGFEIITSAYITAPLDVIRPGPLQTILRKTVFHSDSTRVPVLATAVLVHCRKSRGE